MATLAAFTLLTSTVAFTANITRPTRILEATEQCASVDASSSAWRQDPNAEEAYARQIAMNPDAEPFHPCLNSKCFNYKIMVKKWVPFQLISIKWHEK
eukprot:1610765-Prymnesium_polylepis.1